MEYCIDPAYYILDNFAVNHGLANLIAKAVGVQWVKQCN